MTVPIKLIIQDLPDGCRRAKRSMVGFFVVPTLLNSVRATQDKDLTLFFRGLYEE